VPSTVPWTAADRVPDRGQPKSDCMRPQTGHRSGPSWWAPVEAADQPCGGAEPDQPQEPSHERDRAGLDGWTTEAPFPARAVSVKKDGRARTDWDLGSAPATLTRRWVGSPWPWMSGKEVRSPSPPPLRTVRAPFQCIRLKHQTTHLGVSTRSAPLDLGPTWALLRQGRLPRGRGPHQRGS
jgi:hypothetical protein